MNKPRSSIKDFAAAVADYGSFGLIAAGIGISAGFMGQMIGDRIVEHLKSGSAYEQPCADSLHNRQYHDTHRHQTNKLFI